MRVRRRVRHNIPLFWVVLLLCVALIGPRLSAQDVASLQQVLDRLDRLERANRALLEEVQALRQELKATRGPESYVPERVAVLEKRSEEQAQAKVEASQKFPIQLTGMLLFNVFRNSRHGEGDNPEVAAQHRGYSEGGASLRQTTLGLTFQGPQMLGGAKTGGSVQMDFFSNAGEYDTGGLYSYDSPGLRLRTAYVAAEWKTRSLTVGQLKPLIAPRDPDSFSQVGVPPLSGAGNLWLWRPQIRFEQQLPINDRAGLRAQIGVLQTSELSARVDPAFSSTLAEVRPAIEGRLQYEQRFGSSGRFEIAPGFHTSTTHVAATSVPSGIFSLDGTIAPVKKLELSGAFFNGHNVASLGALGQGFLITRAGLASPVHSTGGWLQASYLATSRLSFHLFGGQQTDRARDLSTGDIGKNRTLGVNAIYRFAPNMLVALEANQTRTTYVGNNTALHHHYDLALAYLF